MTTDSSVEVASSATLKYSVVAMSMPIVYTKEGDHDPNGMIYTLSCYQPLLEWARDRWRDNDQELLRWHVKAQQIQMVIDGLERYERMRRIVRRATHDHWLLEVYREDDEDEVRPNTADQDLTPHRKSFIHNYLATVTEIAHNLSELSDGAETSIDPDPEDRAAKIEILRRQLAEAHAAIDKWFTALENDPERRLDAESLAEQCREHAGSSGGDASGFTSAMVSRLLLNDHRHPEAARSTAMPYDRFNPLKPIPVVRPLVLRARKGDKVEVELQNSISNRRVGFHVQGNGLAGGTNDSNVKDGVRYGDGAKVGNNPDTTVAPGQRRVFHWDTDLEGIWVINDLADVRGTQRGTNAHGLFGAFIVEPPSTSWRDSETGVNLLGTAYADGLYVDIIHADEDISNKKHADFVDFYLDDIPRSHREYTVFIHDEPEIHSPIQHGGHAGVMPLSYRAEPMPNRIPHKIRRHAEATPAEVPPSQVGIDFSAVRLGLDHDLNETYEVARDVDGTFLERVGSEEQHHSSWLFGDPATPILYGYRGDPVRMRVVHGGVKETHVFHLHVHQWRDVPQDTAPPSSWRPGEPRGSALVDSISIGPQGAVTIDPLYGMGSRQKTPGDIIWHCHLYPHFHHGMWGMARSYDRLVTGARSLPDGTPVQPLEPLPGRVPPEPTDTHPGFPWFVDAAYPQKSPPPPATSDSLVSGRRQLLRMPTASVLERNAMSPGALLKGRAGQVFVDLDAQALEWNKRAKLPPPRVIRYDIDVQHGRTDYNRRGWYDPKAHFYKLTGASVAYMKADGSIGDQVAIPLPDDPPSGDVQPFFPRANHGDIVEWRMTNTLHTLPADDFDLIAPPVECGLHVHLVKFDVLAGDGSCTGWNYLSGGSCREVVGADESGRLDRRVTLHRWVVDEEFGPCFFHDHLLANYRQKRGLSGALVAEPVGSVWLQNDQVTPAIAGAEAVIVPGDETKMPPYREACLNIGDFVPLYDEEDRPLNPPGELGGDEDPGTMAVNYRCTPLTHRGDDPSRWFATTSSDHSHDSSSSGRDPDTAIFSTYPGERLRVRLVQGSHEEQHSFVVHGLRWRREWQNPASRLVNQQTIGISEAFSFEIEETTERRRRLSYGPGDYMWKFSAMDDLWLGCWGLIRAHEPSTEMFSQLPPLAALTAATDDEAMAELDKASSTPSRPKDGKADREYVVAARRIEHHHDGTDITDPWGLIYEVADGAEPLVDHHGEDTGHLKAVGVRRTGEPLVLRAHPGEWVKITLINEILPFKDHHNIEDDDNPREVPFGPEVSPPRLPIEHKDDQGFPDERTVSPRASLHASVVRFDVSDSDGAYVGRNRDGTAGSLATGLSGHGGGHGEHGGNVVFRRPDNDPNPANHREYWWYVDRALGPPSYSDSGGDHIGQVCYLYDMADIRNHRHHGLVGALVVEPGNLTPVEPNDHNIEAWTGVNAHLLDDDKKLVANEHVLLLQDGLRLFTAGNPTMPIPDVEPDDDPEDSGQKGINYRTAFVNHREMLADNSPPTPIWKAEEGQRLWLRLICASDKPRNHSFTVHDQAWAYAPWERNGPRIGALSGVAADATYDLELEAKHPGNHAYRSGAFLWSVEQGMWGMIRVSEKS